MKGEPEKLALPVYIRKELAKMKAAGRWDGDPFSPDLDPAVTLSIIMVDERNDAALRAACAKSLIPFIHEDKSLAFKAQASDAGGTVMVVVKSYLRPGLPAPESNYRDEPPPEPPGTPDPPTCAPIDRDRAPGAQRFIIEEGRPIRDESRVPTGYYDPRVGEDGISRLVEMDKPPREYRGEPDAPVVIVKSFKDLKA